MTHNLDLPQRQQQRGSPEGERTEPTGWGRKSWGSAGTVPSWYGEVWAPALPPPLNHMHTPEQGLLSVLTAQGPQGAPRTITSLVHLS